MCPVTLWIIQGCGAVVKMTQFRLRLQSCWFPMSVALAPELSFLMAPALASIRFHTLIFYCLALPQVEWKMN